MSEVETNRLKPAKEGLQRIVGTALPSATLRWDVHTQSDRAELSRLIDLTVAINTQRREDNLAIDVCALGYPKQLRDGIARLDRYHRKADRLPHTLVIAAPFITSEGAALCNEEGIGYFDFAGNCRLRFGDNFIERTGFQPPRDSRPLRVNPDLYSPRSERILRVLLSGKPRPWKVAQLVAKTKTSLGTVSTVRTHLLAREWARDTEDGLLLTQPIRLINDWATVWPRRRQPAMHYFAPGLLADTEKRIADYARYRNERIAFTGLAAAWHRVPMVKYLRTALYYEGSISGLAQALGFQPAESGANVLIMPPRDEGVFFDSDYFDDLPLVSPLQTYLDLQRNLARGPEAAEHLRDTILFPSYA
jgi:hypothetical protein